MKVRPRTAAAIVAIAAAFILICLVTSCAHPTKTWSSTQYHSDYKPLCKKK